METNEKTIVPQHAGTKRKWRIGCVVIITALVILGVVAGVVFTRQQEQHRQETVSYTHLDVYKRQGKKFEKGVENPFFI